MPSAAKHGVEGSCELGVAVTDQEPKHGDPIAEVNHQIAGLLGGPGGGRVRGDAEDVHPPRADLHDKQHVQPPQCDGVDVEEVGRQQPGRLGPQERPPTGVDLTRGRPDPGTGEDAANGAGADPVTEPDELNLDPSMPPSRVLPGQPQDQVTDVVADPWSSRLVRAGPVPADQPAVPGQQRGRGDDPMFPQLPWQRPDQRGQHRPFRPRQARPTDLAA
ncbi:hypothetical protein OHA72_10900 [Dactylosporangium sp. NBC_01737]|nr:hypothetical protein OHA72_10900 [Dactylosporangium sp. NBC_01737]